MHLNLTSMAHMKICDKIVFPIIRRHISASATQQTARATARSFLVRFIADRQRKIQQDDIRREPYISKGVYTESGAIRPVTLKNKFDFVFLILYLDA